MTRTKCLQPIRDGDLIKDGRRQMTVKRPTVNPSGTEVWICSRIRSI